MKKKKNSLFRVGMMVHAYRHSTSEAETVLGVQSQSLLQSKSDAIWNYMRPDSREEPHRWNWSRELAQDARVQPLETATEDKRG